MPAHRPDRELTRWTTKYEAGRDAPVTLLALHESVGVTNAYDLALFCERQGVSYHDITDLTTIVHTVRFTDTAWHLRDGCDASTGLCMTTPIKGYTRAEWLGPQRAKVEIAAWWVARAAAIHRVPIRHCSHSQICAALNGDRASGGVITHNDYTQASVQCYGWQDGTHTDPRGFPIDVCLEMALDISSNGTADSDSTKTREVEMIERRLVKGENAGRINIPTGSASGIVERAWVSVSAQGGGHLRVAFQDSADTDSAPPGTAPIWDTNFKNAMRAYKEIKSGTEFIEYWVTASGEGSLLIETEPK
jgi:hypothetical protein